MEGLEGEIPAREGKQRPVPVRVALWAGVIVVWMGLGLALSVNMPGTPDQRSAGAFLPARVAVCELPPEAALWSGLRVGFWRGVIGPRSAGQLRELLRKDIQVLDLASDGGDLKTAIAMADEIEKAALMTHVSENGGCFSACLVLYQAGRIRYSDDAALFMIHYALQQTKNRKAAEAARFEGTVLFFESLIERGASPAIYENVPPYGELYLTSADAEALGIIASSSQAMQKKTASLSRAIAEHCTPPQSRSFLPFHAGLYPGQ